jgi:hypothetical protein
MADVVKRVGGHPAGVVTVIKWWQKMGLTEAEADKIRAEGRQNEVWNAWKAKQDAAKTRACGECE